MARYGLASDDGMRFSTRRASATAGVGLGANALIGGSNRAVNLQPFSVQAQLGVDVAAGVTAMTLEYAPPPPAEKPRARRHRR